jgi:general secretion pathway protein J
VKSSAPRIRSGTAGFTLIEALVATALMGVILAGLATITAQWLPNWNRGFVRVQRSELVGIALERIIADLAASEFIAPNRESKRPLFDGTELAVTFIRSAIGPNTRPGLEIVRIAESADRQGPVMVRARAPFAPLDETATGQLNLTDPVVLLRAPYRLSFSYAGRDGAWKNTWQNADRLPTTIRLTVRDAATERTLAVSAATAVHVELPANCVAATVGRDCGVSAAPGSEGRQTEPEGGPPQGQNAPGGPR